MPLVPYVQCLVCGRMTPIDRGVCYHCHSPLPSNLPIPPGMIVCPNCLKLTPTDKGFCYHCRAPLPTLYNQPSPNKVDQQASSINENPGQEPFVRVPQGIRVYRIGAVGRVITIGPLRREQVSPRRHQIVGGIE